MEIPQPTWACVLMTNYLPYGNFFLLCNRISSVAILSLILLLWKLIRTKLNQKGSNQTEEELSVLCEKQSAQHSLFFEHSRLKPSCRFRLSGDLAPDQDVCNYIHQYIQLSRNSLSTAFPKKGLPFPIFSIDMVLDLLGWSAHSSHLLYHIVPPVTPFTTGTLLDPDVLSFQTPKVKSQDGDQSWWCLSQAGLTSPKQLCVWKNMQ